MISEQIGLDLLRTYVAICRQGSLSRVAAQTGRRWVLVDSSEEAELRLKQDGFPYVRGDAMLDDTLGPALVATLQRLLAPGEPHWRVALACVEAIQRRKSAR